MNSNFSPDAPNQSRKDIVVPRDPDVDTDHGESEVMPSPDTVNIADEDYPSDDKPLLPESPAARKLHENPPQGTDQLEVGSAGDAARPSKTGIMNTTLPPRGQMR
jgi:hypothetical protein